MADYTASEMMIAASARELKGERVVFVGIGLPNIACNLAQRTVAPDLELVYEAGVYGARPSRLPPVHWRSLSGHRRPLCRADDPVVPILPPGWLDRRRLPGVAQIDRYGNLNTTVIGPYDSPKFACRAAAAPAKSLCWPARFLLSPDLANAPSSRSWISSPVPVI